MRHKENKIDFKYKIEGKKRLSLESEKISR